MKPLPYIAIEGVGKTKEEVLDSLIAIEPILVKLGYDVPNEDYNNEWCNTYEVAPITHITAYGEKIFSYRNHPGLESALRFKSTEIDKLIKYMINNKYIK